MLKLHYKENSSLPYLAWCAHISCNGEALSLTVHHGSWVETDELSFSEGAWSGEFVKNEFLDAATFTGTGGMVGKDAESFFATPTNTLQPLYLLEKKRSKL